MYTEIRIYIYVRRNTNESACTLTRARENIYYTRIRYSYTPKGGVMKGEIKGRRKGSQAGRERRGGGRGDAERIKARALTEAV